MPRIDPYGNRSQCMILVLQSLSELGGSNTKQDVLSFIRSAGYFAVTKHDLPPYPGQNESRYHTLLAWARKDCVERDLILNHEFDSWALSIPGREKIADVQRLCASLEYDVTQCYLWTPLFKKKMNPSYTPSDRDRQRPEDVIDEILKSFE